VANCYHAIMKHGGKILACLMGSLALCAAANEVTPDVSANPYQSIVDRNVFGLKPPPPPPDTSEANKAPVLKITLTGMTDILGNKRVLMKTAPPPGKPGEPPKTEQSYILAEGQREGDIEVLEINDKVGSVKVNNAGTVQTLTFEKDGAKLPATPAPVAPGVPPAAGGAASIPGLPGARPLPQPPGASPTPSFQLPTRTPRLPQVGSQPSVGGVMLPGFQGGGAAASQNPSQAAPPTPQYSLEEQAIMIEANRLRGGPGAELLPPTILTPKAAQSTTPAQSPALPSRAFPPMPGQPSPPY
jgi:hypothetical protein